MGAKPDRYAKFPTASEIVACGSSLIPSKLDKYGKLSNKELIDSLAPGQNGSLKARPDGTMVDGHHRIKILRDRGVDGDNLPREIIPKEPVADLPP